jgi:hypothetical protein
VAAEGVRERLFMLDDIPGVLWTPEDSAGHWDDELVPRDSGLELFGSFASGEKTLHANPGRHAEVPAFELESSVRFFTRHFITAG